MNALKTNLIIYLTLSFFTGLLSQNIETRGRITNSVYVYDDSLQKSYVDASSGATESKHVRLYQFLRFQAIATDWNNLTFSLAARALTDLNPDMDIDAERRFNAYRLSIGARGLFDNFLDFELGRQFLHPGVVLGSLDGLNLKLHPVQNLEWQLYGGVESHLYRAMELYEPDDAAVFGTSVKYRDLAANDLQLVYLQKNRSGEEQWQITGLNLNNYMANNLVFLMQAHYDMVNSRFHRLYVSGRYNWNNKFSAGIYVKQQYPQVYGDSYFRMFDISQYRLIGGDVAYALTSRYSVNTTFQTVMLEEGYGNRAIVSINDPNGSIGIIFETGDLGEQVGALLNYGYEIIPELLASLSVDYSRYRFEEIYEYESQLANAARLDYRFNRNWRAVAEYQWLTNRIKDSDQRILNHIHFIW